MSKDIKAQHNAFKILFLLVIYIVLNVTFIKNATAQNAISLSISPAIIDVMIQPGKEFKQSYIIQNNGGDTVITPNIFYFTPSDDYGSVNLTEDIAPDWIKFSRNQIAIKSGEQTSFNISISPPENTEETDHYLTLLFSTVEPQDILGQTAIFHKSEIGSNILVTVSKDGIPKKSAEIIKFNATKITDSFFSKIKYNVIVKNNGNSFWKPKAKILISDKESLKVAPLNVLSRSTRVLSCINNETLNECIYKPKFTIGKVTSVLEFTIDEDSKIYRQTATTFFVPFSLIFLTLILLTLFKIKWIFKLWGRKK